MKPFVFLFLPLFAATATGQITHLDRWFLVEDPPNANLNASIGGAGAGSAATLTAADAPIPAGTDIGYQSIQGLRAEDSSAGYVFDPAADFSVAIDYEVTFSENGAGTGLGLGLGFGIGEDGDGTNSAGIAMLRTRVEFGPGLSTTVLGIAGVARIDDVNQPQKLIGAADNNAANDGSLFIRYTASTGDISVGHSETPGALAAGASAAFPGIQKQWAGRDLIVSFFLRSEGWTGGGATAVFRNPRVLGGTPREIPPKVISVARAGDWLNFSFKGGAGWSYRIEGGSDLGGFPDDLSGAPSTSLLETPAGSGIFTGSVDVSGKGASYFFRFGAAGGP